MNTTMVCRRFFITGRVQGVAYRANTVNEAQRLGLTGWVRNSPDGGVEALACGEASAMTAFEKWLWQGPRQARVDEVRVEAVAGESAAGFEIRY